MENDIFVSYRRNDLELVDSLVSVLEGRGISVWFDQEIQGGELWRQSIVDNLSASKIMVVMFSEACNKSKELAKELAVAAHFEEAIVPVLIEDTEPKGHYLYELASRNWLQIHPNPETKLERLADQLAQLIPGSTHTASLASPPPVAPPAPPPAPAQSPAVSDAASVALPSGAAPSPPLASVKPAAASRAAGQNKRFRDYLPFKWYEWAVWGLLALLFLAMDDTAEGDRVDAWIGLLAVVSVYGAIAFPIRYYLWGRRPVRALLMHLLSLATLQIPLYVFLIVTETPSQGVLIGILAAVVLILAFTAVSFMAYGLLLAQRKMRQFRSNVQTL